MKVEFTKRVMEKMKEMTKLRNISGMLNMALTAPLTGQEIYPDDVELLRKDALEAKAEMEKEGDDHLSVEMTMLMIMLQDLAKPFIHDENILSTFMFELENHCMVFSKKEYEENPYYKNIRFDCFDKEKRGNFELGYRQYKAFELWPFGAPHRLDGEFIDIPRIGCFDDEFKFPVIAENGAVWMSVTPNEVISMVTPLSHAKGRVLTLGLGMGYFAYMASLKDDVESVTIIEKEQAVIDLFTEYILPQFETKDKINIIKSDAVTYVQNLADDEYDYCFADIWQGAMNIDVYFKVKEACRKRFVKMKVDYWIEDSFIMGLMSSVILEITMAFYKAGDIPAPAMPNLSDFEKKQREYISRLLEKECISKPEHIDYYADPQTLLKLIDKTDITWDNE